MTGADALDGDKGPERGSNLDARNIVDDLHRCQARGLCHKLRSDAKR
jgi:hypothetical protein